MSMSIRSKLQTLEDRLTQPNGTSEDAIPPRISRPQNQMRGTRNMILPIQTPTTTKTEADKKLENIKKRSGILQINGRQYETKIDDMKHLDNLGNGTSGNVVKMRHISSDTVIAVKQMRRTGNSEENKRILMDLDVVLKSHDCPNIVQCLGYFITDPDVWICMELMSMCFDKLLKLSKRSIPEEILGKITVATVKALSYLKENHDVIHRDVKPSNILIDDRGNIKLCDFGISGRLVDSKANTRSAGCVAYMAPERIDPRNSNYDIRADVWSLGITLIELATVRSPYEGCKTDFEVLTKIVDSDPPRLPKEVQFSKEFMNFVNKCLVKNHLDRPKYPELLEQPFIKIYEQKDVNVADWFMGIKSHIRDLSSTDTTTLNSIIKNTTNLGINKPAAVEVPKNIYNNKQSHLSRDLPISTSTINNVNNLNLNIINNKKTPLPSSLPQSINYKLTTTNSIKRYQIADDEVDQRIHGSGGVGSGGSSSNIKSSQFLQRKISDSQKKESVFSNIGQNFIRNFITSPFSQKKIQNQQSENSWINKNATEDAGGGIYRDGNALPRNNFIYQHSPIPLRKLQTNSTISDSSSNQDQWNNSNRHFGGNTSPIVLQRFYHQQNQLRERERERKLNEYGTSSSQLNFNNSHLNSKHDHHLQIRESVKSCSSDTDKSPTTATSQTAIKVSGIPVMQNYKSFSTHTDNSGNNSTLTTNYNGNSPLPITTPTMTTTKINSKPHTNEQGVVKRQLSSYVKLHLANNEEEEIGDGSVISSPVVVANTASKRNEEKKYNFLKYDQNKSYDSNTIFRTTPTTITQSTITTTSRTNNNTSTTTASTTTLPNNTNTNEYHRSRQYPLALQSLSPLTTRHNTQTTIGFDRRHRSPDPPPRLNRGQSPLLLRKNLLELQQNGVATDSPNPQRRFFTSSPPLPPPRRGSESVPGSPQHFRTRIHYTPEPQRRVYRSIDQ